uniref:Protein FAR1-RELATED SEQUENCE n=1 Tax=Lactuca sativa TaxID=4236 RepID=A0A9R1XKN6_LACSA|nr:hypothetical protein LSAT_V11C300149330 [Lactuca sativa]
MINKMNDQKDQYPNYSFEFLYADEREKAFYAEFGEVISFDVINIYNLHNLYIYDGSWYFHYKYVGTKNGWELYKVEQQDKINDLKIEFEVEIKLQENDVKCTCEHFNRFGTLCRHVFNILMKHGIKEIPEHYIENRWRKDVISMHYHFCRHVYDT